MTYSQAVNTYQQDQETQLAFYDASRNVREKEEIFMADDITTQRYNPTVFKVQ